MSSRDGDWNPLDVSWLGPLDPTSWFKQELPGPAGASPSVPLRVHPEHGRGQVAVPTANHSAPQLRQGLEHRMSGQGVPVHRDARTSESPVRGASHEHQHGHNRHSHHNHGRPDVEGTLKKLTFEAHDMHWRKSANTSSCVGVADAVLRGGAESELKQNIRLVQMQHTYEAHAKEDEAMIDKAERENRQFSNFVDAKKEWHYNSPQHQHHHHERQHEHHQYHKHEQYTLHGNYHNTAVASVSNALKAPGTASNPETLAMTRNREEDKRVLRAKGGFGGLF